MSVSILKIAALLTAVITLALLLYIYAPGGKQRLEAFFSLPPETMVDFTSLKKTDKPNQYLVCPQNYCAQTPDRIAPLYTASTQELAQTFEQIAMSMPDVEKRGPPIAGSGFIQYNFVQRTPTMRYPDLITVRFFEHSQGQTGLAVYSRSVYGRSDFGVNQKRIDSWLDILDKRLKT
jgi:uncharacterized protein (DUF1499 family)